MIKIILRWIDIADSKLVKEFDEKGGIDSFSKFIEKTSQCECKSIPSDNQEDMSNDAWELSFDSENNLKKFCEKYEISFSLGNQKSLKK